MKKVICTWGLPGSGKTTFCQNKLSYTNRHHNNITPVVLSYDDICYGNINTSEKNKLYVNRINDYLGGYYKRDTYLDTLVTTNEGFANLFSQLKITGAHEICIQYWMPDRDACMWNDRYRRSVDSGISITNMPFEIPDVAVIKELCPNLKNITITVTRNNVTRKAGWKMFADRFGINHTDGVFKSDTWSMGGTSGNCWNDNLYAVSGDTPLSTFKEFDELMEQAVPTLGFLQYKKIYNNCVSSETYSEGDYYGGSVTYGFYQCDISKLYDELVTNNLIDVNEE